MAGKRKFTDWESIEPLYRAGYMSLNDICDQYAADHQNSTVWSRTVTHQAISLRAKSKKWTKNIANRVRERVQEKLIASPVAGCKQTEEEIIEAASSEPVLVRLGQRARTHMLLKDQDSLAIELRENKENLDVVTRVRAFKDISAAVNTHHAEQSKQYKLDDTTTDDKTRIKVSRVAAGE